MAALDEDRANGCVIGCRSASRRVGLREGRGALTALPIRRRLVELTIELNRIGPLNARRGGVEAERQRLITQVQVLEDAMSADQQAIAAIEEEGRVAGALPGWFR